MLAFPLSTADRFRRTGRTDDGKVVDREDYPWQKSKSVYRPIMAYLVSKKTESGTQRYLIGVVHTTPEVDGGLAEFNTAVRHKSDLIVIVCNDGAYGAEHIKFRNRQMDPGVILFDWPEIFSLETTI